MGNPFTRIASWGPERDLNTSRSAGLSTPLITIGQETRLRCILGRPCWCKRGPCLQQFMPSDAFHSLLDFRTSLHSLHKNDQDHCVFGLTSVFWLCFLYGQAIVFLPAGHWVHGTQALWCKPSLAATKTKEKVRRGRARSHGKCKGIKFAYVLGRSCTILVPSFLYFFSIGAAAFCFYFFEDKVFFWDPLPTKKRIEGVIFRVLVYASKPSAIFVVRTSLFPIRFFGSKRHSGSRRFEKLSEAAREGHTSPPVDLRFLKNPVQTIRDHDVRSDVFSFCAIFG